MTQALAQVRQSSNYASDLSPETKRAIMTLYHAHWPDHRIAFELGIEPATVARFRAARFLSAK
jgi:FixJ family two-component response regulator